MTTATPEPRGNNLWATFTADMVSYVDPGIRPWSPPFLRRLAREMFLHPGALAIVVYRYGQWVFYRCRVPVVRQLFQLHYLGLYWWVRTHLQIELPHNATIGPGLRIYHFGSIIVHSKTVAGKNLGLNHRVLIGMGEGGVPQLGDGVSIAPGAIVFGGITLGDGVLVGAGSLVNKSFPDNAIVAGVPAKLLRLRGTPKTEALPEPLPLAGPAGEPIPAERQLDGAAV